jgi:6-phospho-3-hexuloisomerase
MPVDDPVGAIAGEIAGALDRVDRSAVAELAARLDAAPRVMIAGEGRSGLMAKAFAMRLMHLGLTVFVVGETTTPAVAEGDSLVAVSGSGTTAATVRTAGHARDVGAQVFAVTTESGSELGTLADFVLEIPAATKYRRAGEAATVQPLSSLFDQATHLVLDAVCLRLADLRGVDNATARRTHRAD